MPCLKKSADDTKKVLKAAKSGAPSSGVDIAGISGGMPGKPGANRTARPEKFGNQQKANLLFLRGG